ncbi:hypothetical protein [Sinorhizobium fredii]|uniref:hypothetical protein n=1 Tax=Rhizobium fredii TaxID=380 RepID=UPI00131A22E5|nr:hypothetical protein [Sinorhizobium fredii]
MSISEVIKTHCENPDETLRLLVPARPSYLVQRHIFLGKEVQQFVDGDGVDGRFARLSGRTLSVLERISNGSYVTFGMDPHDKDASCTIARVDPVLLGIVDVRIRDPQPAIRVFGGFAEPDILVLLKWMPRAGLDFRAAAQLCRQEWDSLFPGHPPIYGEKVEDYVSKHFNIG